MDVLQDLEQETGKEVNVVLQLRMHPAILELRTRILKSGNAEKHDIELTYITSRGTWYDYSWKGEIRKSGGIATNIGIHFFDMLIWIFGPVQHSEIHVMENRRASGFLELEKARVKWYLSLNRSDLPETAVQAGQSTFRMITINNLPLEFSSGFTDLHTLLYKKTFDGNGFTLEDARPSIELVQKMRYADRVQNDKNRAHPLVFRGNL